MWVSSLRDTDPGRRADADDRRGQRQCGNDQHERASDLESALPARRFRHGAGKPAMHEIARDHRDQRDQHERRIGRTTVERHGGQQVVHQVKRRRIGAERVEEHEPRRDGEETDLARPGDTANEAERHDGDERQRTGIDQAHILREIESRPSPRGVPDLALRRPVFDARVHCAEKVGEGKLQQVHGVE